MPRSPRRRIPFVTVASRIDDAPSTGWVDASPLKLDRSNDGQDHTVLPYASAPFIGTRLVSTHGVRLNPLPALRITSAPTLPASTASRPAFATTYDRPLSGSRRRADTLFPNFGKENSFRGRGLTKQWSDLPGARRAVVPPRQRLRRAGPAEASGAWPPARKNPVHGSACKAASSPAIRAVSFGTFFAFSYLALKKAVDEPFGSRTTNFVNPFTNCI